MLFFDVGKLILYTLYFGKQQLNDFVGLYRNCYGAGFGDFFLIIWNFMVLFCNIGNFILFWTLSKDYDVNDILRNNVYINTARLSEYYSLAQLFDSGLVLMNMLMLI